MRLRASAVILHNGSVLLIHRRKNGVEYYVLPGGKIELGETPEEAVIRELTEELGVVATVMQSIGELPLPEIDQYTYLLQCSMEEFGQPLQWLEDRKQTDSNVYNVAWVPVHALQTLALRPKEAISYIQQVILQGK